MALSLGICVILVILNSLSFIASVWMMVKSMQGDKTLLQQPIFFICLADAFWAANEIVVFSYGVVRDFTAFERIPLGCSVLGGVVHFALMTALCWTLVIIWLTIFLLRGNSSIRYASKSRMWCHLFVWGFVSVNTAIPAAGGAFGVSSVTGTTSCWISKPIFYLAFYIPVIICFLCFAVLTYYVAQYKQMLTSSAMRTPLLRMMGFATSFVLIWLIPTIRRIYIAYNPNIPTWLTYAHTFPEALIGLINAVVWTRSQKSAKEMKLTEEFSPMTEFLPPLLSSATTQNPMPFSNHPSVFSQPLPEFDQHANSDHFAY